MAKHINVNTSISEDFEKLGISNLVSEGVQSRLAGLTETTEESVVTGGLPRIDSVVNQKVLGEDKEDKVVESKEITAELIDRINGLRFDLMSESDFEELADALSEMTLPEDASDELVEKISAVRERLSESKDDEDVFTAEYAEKIKGLDFGSMSEDDLAELGEALSKIKCEDDMRDELDATIKLVMDEGKKEKIIKAGKKVTIIRKTGGEAAKARREGKKYRMTHKAALKKSRKKQKIKARRSGSAQAKTARKHAAMGEASEFANELRALLSEGKEVVESSLRDEIIDRVGSVLEKLENEINDDAVVDLMVEQFDAVMDLYGNGNLSESNMDDDEFVNALNPALVLIQKCFDKVEEGAYDAQWESVEEDEIDDVDDVDDDEDLLGNLKALASDEG